MARKSLVKNIGDADLKLLRIFKSVAESGGLAAAETELNIGRSTISKHLSDLEYRLDLRLCNRGPAGFSLTVDGRKVLDAAEGLLESVANFRAEVNEIKHNLVGTIRISMFDQCASNPESRLGASINAFNKLAPDVEIELSQELPTTIEAMVISGHTDIGLIAEHRISPSLDYTPLYGEDMYLYCSSKHPLFGRDPGSLSMEEVRAARYAGISVNCPNLYVGQKLRLRRAAKVQSEQALSVLILSGRYTGFLPDHLAKEFVKRGEVQAILPEKINYRASFSAVTRRSPDPHRITKIFLETLVKTHAVNNAA